MNKQTALALANADVVNTLAAVRQAGKAPECEAAKLEAMCNAVLAKGETLGDQFFARIADSANGRDIFRAIHAA
jgi:CII-binding regulator of phage lambda lysogenization HflD